jgi:hypothetical protein
VIEGRSRVSFVDDRTGCSEIAYRERILIRFADALSGFSAFRARQHMSEGSYWSSVDVHPAAAILLCLAVCGLVPFHVGR